MAKGTDVKAKVSAISFIKSHDAKHELLDVFCFQIKTFCYLNFHSPGGTRDRQQ